MIGWSADVDPMDTDRRSSSLVCRIFFDEPAATSSENDLARL